MNAVPEADVDEERERGATGVTRCRWVALAVAVVIVTVGSGVAACTIVRRPGRRDAGSPVTQVGLLNVVARPNVHRPVLQVGLRWYRARRRGLELAESTGRRRSLSRMGSRR